MPSLHSRAQAFPHTATKAGEQPRPPRGPGGSARCRSHPYHAIADPAPGLRARIRRPPLTAASGRSPEFTHVYCSACHDYCSERIPRTRKLPGSGCAGAVCLQCPSQSRFNFRLFLFLCSKSGTGVDVIATSVRLSYGRTKTGEHHAGIPWLCLCAGRLLTGSLGVTNVYAVVML